jgi:hypothetical protein
VVDDHNLAPVPIGHIVDLLAQLPEARAPDGLRQSAVLHHASDVQVLDGKHPGALDQLGTDLVQQVAA